MRTGENRQDPARKLLQNGSAIHDFRAKAGMSRRILAERVQISAPHLANIENEHKSTTYEVLYRISTALVVNIRSVLRDPPTPAVLDQLMYEEAREQAS